MSETNLVDALSALEGEALEAIAAVTAEYRPS
jgi:hypothetical protein